MTPKEILQKYWGYKNFRPLQEDIINSILDGNDTLALLPTGGGKSICFQVPALLKEGICIVVSPLIALMKDQVENLNKKGIPATSIYSGMSFREIDIILDQCIFNKYKFLYVSPERLKTELFIERLKKMNVNILAVDEAHCISQWGYDFRPPYLEIANIRDIIPNVPVIALTATATPEVVEDIQEKLRFKKRNVFQKSFYRHNLAYIVIHSEDKINRLLRILDKIKGSAVIYVRNRKKTEEISSILTQNNVSADFYHAGLATNVRNQKQENWIKGKTRIIVCTNAFGMGIDKPDVRLVVHLDLPDSLEAYFQEAGRAGRDEKNSYAICLYNNADITNLEKFVEDSFPDLNSIKTTYQAITNYLHLPIGSGYNMTYEIDISEICNNYNLNRSIFLNSLVFLVKEGYISINEAFSNPSRLVIEVDKETIYRFWVKNPPFEPLIKFILRNYQGVFSDFVKIDESFIANKLNTTKEKIMEMLKYLNNLNIISYVPQNEKPTITFNTPRLDQSEIMVSKEHYYERKKIAIEKANAVISYVKANNRCRSQLLLLYFGENKKERCGHCDYCARRNKANLSQTEFDNIVEQIKPILTKEPTDINTLVKLIDGINEEKILNAVRWLMDNNKILIDDKGKLYWKQKNNN